MNFESKIKFGCMAMLRNFHKICKFYHQKYFVKEFGCGLSLQSNIYIKFIKLRGDAIIDHVNF